MYLLETKSIVKIHILNFHVSDYFISFCVISWSIGEAKGYTRTNPKVLWHRKFIDLDKWRACLLVIRDENVHGHRKNASPSSFILVILFSFYFLSYILRLDGWLSLLCLPISPSHFTDPYHWFLIVSPLNVPGSRRSCLWHVVHAGSKDCYVIHLKRKVNTGT